MTNRRKLCEISQELLGIAVDLEKLRLGSLANAVHHIQMSVDDISDFDIYADEEFEK